MRNKWVTNITVKRWFDKVNGNSYYNFVATLSDGVELRTECNIYYGYGSNLMWYIKPILKKIWYNINKWCDITDLDYGLKRDMINL